MANNKINISSDNNKSRITISINQNKGEISVSGNSKKSVSADTKYSSGVVSINNNDVRHYEQLAEKYAIQAQSNAKECANILADTTRTVKDYKNFTTNLEENITNNLNTHIENKDNPHNVTAEQLNVYTKTESDNKYLVEHQDLSDYAKESEIPDISGKADKVEIPKKVSELENDNGYLSAIPDEYITETELNQKGYLTEHQDISGKADKTEIPKKLSQLTDDLGNSPVHTHKQYLTEHQDLSSYAKKTEIPDISGKQDKITDLETIRAGAKAGSTALQAVPDTYAKKSDIPDISGKANKADLAEVATSGNYDDLLNKPVIPPSVGVDTVLSDTSENAVQNKVITSALNTKQDKISDLETIRANAKKGSTALQKIPDEYITETELNQKGYLTQHQDISGKANKADLDIKVSKSGDTMTGNLTVGSSSIKTNGYIQGTWLQSTAASQTTNINSYCVFDPSGWIYKVSPDKVLDNIGGQAKITDLETIRANSNLVSTKQDKLTAGENITIADNTISASDTTPVGTIIHSGADLSANGKYAACDGKWHKSSEFPELYACTPKPITYYRLCNTTRGDSYWQNLWTTDPTICNQAHPDLSKLFRQIDNDDYKVGFCNIGEDITMTGGTVTSASTFYDGHYTVDTAKSYTKNGYSYNEILTDKANSIYLPVLNNYDIIPYIYTGFPKNNISKVSLFDHGNRSFSIDYYKSAAITDRTIADNFYLTKITDGKYLSFYDWYYKDNKQTADPRYISSNDMLSFSIQFDFITPSTFIANRDIFHAYRALVFRTGTVTDNIANLNMYMGTYTSGKSRPWRWSNKWTGFTLEPDTKYRIKFYCYEHTTINSTSEPFTWYVELQKWSPSGWTNLTPTNPEPNNTNVAIEGNSYTFKNAYYPYNYTNNYGISSVYCADATAWTEGQFFDLSSLKSTHTRDNSSTVKSYDLNFYNFTQDNSPFYSEYADNTGKQIYAGEDWEAERDLSAIYLPALPDCYIKVKK